MPVKRKRGRPRTRTPKAIAPNAFSLWLMKHPEVTMSDFADLVGVTLGTVYCWRRGSPPRRHMAATIERLTDGAVPMSSWD